MENKLKKRLIGDGIIIAVSIIVACLLIKSSILDAILLATKGHFFIQTLIAGFFFTSAFTTAPAIVVLGKIGLLNTPWIVALVGGIGALLGDLIIFKFIKSHVAEDINALLSKAKSHRIRHIFKYRFIRWSLAFLGALIIASPLPDELGLALMGLSKISTRRFILISFIFNFLGILIICYVARSI